MSDKKTRIGDEMVEAQLKEISNKLNISIDALIDQYIRIGLYMDDYYKAPKLSKEKLLEIFKLDEEPKKSELRNKNPLVGIYRNEE